MQILLTESIIRIMKNDRGRHVIRIDQNHFDGLCPTAAIHQTIELTDYGIDALEKNLKALLNVILTYRHPDQDYVPLTRIEETNQPKPDYPKEGCDHEWMECVVKNDRPFEGPRNAKLVICKKCFITDVIYRSFPDGPCQHESDGKMYGPMEWGAAATFKCKYCGEMYK